MPGPKGQYDTKVDVATTRWAKGGLEAIAAATGRTASAVARQAVAEYLVRHGLLPPDGDPHAQLVARMVDGATTSAAVSTAVSAAAPMPAARAVQEAA